MRPLGLLCLVVLTLAGGSGGGEGENARTEAPTAPSVGGGGGPVIIGQGACSLVVIIQGNRTEVRGDVGSTVNAGGITIIFGPNCSSTVLPSEPPG